MERDDVLRASVREHHVCAQMLPLREADHGHLVQVGYEVHLFGATDHAAASMEELERTHAVLRTIATAVLPPERQCTACVVDPFDGTCGLRPETGLQPEVQLRVRIVHRRGYFQPVNACEQKCVRELLEGLRRLGVADNVWKAP